MFPSSPNPNPKLNPATVPFVPFPDTQTATVGVPIPGMPQIDPKYVGRKYGTIQPTVGPVDPGIFRAQYIQTSSPRIPAAFRGLAPSPVTWPAFGIQYGPPVSPITSAVFVGHSGPRISPLTRPALGAQYRPPVSPITSATIGRQSGARVSPLTRPGLGVHSSEADFPRGRYGQRVSYGADERGRAVLGPVGRDQYFVEWDQVGPSFRDPIPRDKPLPQTELEFVERHGFRFEKVLGRGAYGVVWEVIATQLHKNAENEFIDARLACKILSLSKFEKDRTVKEAIEKLTQESELQSELNHRNIIKTEHVFHIHDQKGDFPEPIRLCHFMELCNGDLKELIDDHQNRKMDEFEANYWFKQIMRAVKYLHDRNIVHLDIKPTNVLYQDKVNTPRVFKLTDFGLSIKYAEGQPMTADKAHGTRMYMAPEMRPLVIVGTYQTKPCDIYSLGVTLAESLSGRAKFFALLKVAQQWQPNNAFDIEKEVSQLITNMTANDPQKRFTIEQVCAHLWSSIFD